MTETGSLDLTASPTEPTASNKDPGRWRTVLARAAFTAVATTTLVLAPGLQSANAVGVSGTVPNMFYRTCSNVTARCTGYHQTNGPYNPNYPSRYYTTSCWCWI